MTLSEKNKKLSQVSKRSQEQLAPSTASLDHSGLPLGESASAVTPEEASSPKTPAPASLLPPLRPPPTEDFHPCRGGARSWCRNHPTLILLFLPPYLTIRNNKKIALCPNWCLPPAELSGSWRVNSTPICLCTAPLLATLPLHSLE